MAKLPYYKRIENNLVQKIRNGVRFALSKIGSFFAAVFTVLFRRYTIVLVPHSEKKVYNFRVSIIAITLFFLVVFGGAVSLVRYNAIPVAAQGNPHEWNSQLESYQENLDTLREELRQLSQAARGFEAALHNTLYNLGPHSNAIGLSAAHDRLPALSLVRSETPGATPLREVDYIRNLAMYLTHAVQPITEIGSVLNSHSTILSEIPSIWPIRGGLGQFTSMFGIRRDPFTGALRMHTGVDISTGRSGDPIVATADGEVVFAGFQPGGFGNYVVLRHRHGFYTLYAHMLSFRVTTGQQVQQGEIIGFIGSTGRSTGPHLHYEIHIGTNLVNPLQHLNIRPGSRR